jgi:hypothetical protein
METDEVVKTRIEKMLPILNKQQRRIYLGAEAQSIGWGGTTKIAQLTSVSRRTIAKGAIEMADDEKSTKQKISRRERNGRRRNH